jgi:hypothetical protein
MSVVKVLFVHGTGVRHASYQVSVARIIRGLDGLGVDASLENCLWGDVLGAKLGANGKSIPKYAEPLAKPLTDDQTEALWELLGRDPLFELRELAASPKKVVPPNAKQVKVNMRAVLKGFRQDRDLIYRLQPYTVVTIWDKAVASVVNDKVLDVVFDVAGSPYAPLRVACARALVASLQRELSSANMPSLPVSERDSIVDYCLEKLGGVEMGGLMDWFSARLEGLVVRLLNMKAKRSRDALFSSVAPMAGDVMMYQARGEPIREFIEKRIIECGSDVIVLAHSLGGIACVELLIEKSLPQVKALVTVGSQAPFLYEINALRSLSFGEKLPEHFPKRWINFYDCNDFLSYRASDLFSGRVEDIEVASRLPFPDSHSGYWDLPELWKRLEPVLA